MALLEELPPSVETTLKEVRNGTGHLPLAAAVKADLGIDGMLGERWVVVDQDALRVLTPNGDERAHVDLEVPLGEIRGASTENLVGGGALTVARGSETLELVRYTSPLAGRMSGLARTIEALAKNEETPELHLDDEKRVCPTCGRPLPGKLGRVPVLFGQARRTRPFVFVRPPHRAQAIALVVLMFAGTAMSLAPGVIIKNLTDKVLVPQEPVAQAARLGLLGWLVLALIATQLLGLLSRLDVGGCRRGCQPRSPLRCAPRFTNVCSGSACPTTTSAKPAP
jgi:ATP-binding cassette subfamily B protein